MMDAPSPRDRLGRLIASARGRLRPAHGWAAVAVAGVVAVGALGLGALKSVELPNARPIDPSNMMRVELVAPREPDIEAGEVMEVGELVDGYEHRPAPTIERAVYEDAWPLAEFFPSRRPPAVEYDETPDADRYRPIPDERESRGRWFGFDLPRPDWRAEREARRERMEAAERERRERERAYDDRRRWEQERAYAERRRADERRFDDRRADDRRDWDREQARRDQALRDDRRPFLREEYGRAPEPRWGDPDAEPVG